MELRHRNWRCRVGEIDLVMQDQGTLVFVEVKSRTARTGRQPYLFENITAVKIRRVRLLAEIYLSFYYHKRRHPDVRIDVVGVMLDANSGSVTQIKHIRAAF